MTKVKSKLFKRLFTFIFLLVMIGIITISFANKQVEEATVGKNYDDLSNIPHNKVGLLLGTGKYLQDGRVNLYYQYRIDAAVALYEAGKLDFLLISGDNSTQNYDEPTSMKNDLIAAGIPEEKIYLDYAGFRTLDSVVRSKEIFGQSSITIISQKFHNQRAIYIAQAKEINAVGFNAKDVNIHYGLKTMLREKLARVKMFLDLQLGKEPKFLGEKIYIK
ncbi:MAG: YdcF family protein [Marinifilum sp.]|jgi:SanA protein|nr:YdcF family protein [Marinifilum sp.]